MAGLVPRAPLVVIVGATGTGKSQLAVDLAVRFHGEVINGDAMQLYEGLPIITNKIPVHERQNIPHHLLGCVHLSEPPWTVSDFVTQASRAIHDIQGRGKLPILVGGTHYYLQTLLFEDTLARKPGQDNKEVPVSNQEPSQPWPILEAATPIMYEELKRVDPLMAQRWHPNDRRKIRRSLEIWLQSGTRASEIYAQQNQQNTCDTTIDDDSREAGSPAQNHLRYSTLILWTHTARDVLNSRLDRRVDSMTENGLLDEVKMLSTHLQQHDLSMTPIDQTRGIWIAIGFKEFREYMRSLQSKTADEATLNKHLSNAIVLTQTATRQYARSQLKWIRIKLVNALRRAHADCAMFLLNTNDPSLWSEVVDPAAKLVQSFLNGDPLPDPTNGSEEAHEMLVPKQDYDLGKRMDLWKTETCDLCNVTATTETQWEQHIGSRGHKNAVKIRNKRQGQPLAAGSGE